MQTRPALQARAHIPQLNSSESRFVQVMPQAVWPSRQAMSGISPVGIRAHMPPMHRWFSPQAFPQMPQLLSLVTRSVQLPLQQVVPPDNSLS